MQKKRHSAEFKTKLALEGDHVVTGSKTTLSLKPL